MWNAINNDKELRLFMEKICNFHDSCIKEIKYLSGAYVDENLSMKPINTCRTLSVIIQRQFERDSTIELEFSGLKHMNLCPNGEEYTCEILDATMLFTDEGIYWCDCGGVLEQDIKNYRGTVICALNFRWRAIDNALGKDKIYHSII